MTAAHTPGPWAIDWNVARLDIFSGDAATLIASLRRSTLSPAIDDVAKANAKLIAAAPELLEACQTFAEWLRREEAGCDRQGTAHDTPEGRAVFSDWFYENVAMCDLAQKQARAAIAKATGDAA